MVLEPSMNGFSGAMQLRHISNMSVWIVIEKSFSQYKRSAGGMLNSVNYVTARAGW